MLVEGKPVHLILLGDSAEAAKWVGYARKLMADSFIAGTTQKIQYPASDVSVSVENLGSMGKIHIQAGGSKHGFFCNPVSSLTNAGWIIDPTTKAWGALKAGFDYLGQWVFKRKDKAPFWASGKADKEHKLAPNTTEFPLKGGTIAAQHSKNSYSVKGYATGWLPRALHGKESYLGSVDPNDMTAAALVCYDYYVSSPVYKNGIAMTLTNKTGSELLDTNSSVGVGVGQTSDKKDVLLGISIADTKKGIYHVWRSLDFKEAEITGSFTVKNQINGVVYPIVFFFNKSGTRASGIVHSEDFLSGDQVNPSLNLGINSVESRAFHVNLIGGVYQSALDEGSAPLPIAYATRSWDDTTGDVEQVTTTNGVSANVSGTTERTIAIGYVADIEKRAKLRFTFTKVIENGQINGYDTPSAGWSTGRSAGASCGTYNAVGRSQNASQDYRHNTLHMDISLVLGANTISIFSGVAQDDYAYRDTMRKSDFYYGWSIYNGCGPQAWGPNTSPPAGVYSSAAAWAEAYIATFLATYPTGDAYYNGTSIIGGILFADVEFRTTPSGGYSSQPAVASRWIYDTTTGTTYGGILTSQAPFVNLIAVDLTQDQVYYDKLVIAQSWPVTLWPVGGAEPTYDSSSGFQVTRSVYRNDTVLVPTARISAGVHA